MSEKHIVVQGATCQCQFGTSPDKLMVKSQSKEYANDKNGSQKLIATTKETGSATFEKNTFGSCSLQRNKPCQTVVSAWQGFYDKVILSNDGQILLEDSKAICPISGSPSISVTNHGQIAEMAASNFKKADSSVHTQLNPTVNVQQITKPERKHEGLEDATK